MDLEPKHKFKFNISEELPFIGLSYFDMDELLQRIIDHQQENPAYYPDLAKRQLPLSFNLFTESDMAYT